MQKTRNITKPYSSVCGTVIFKRKRKNLLASRKLFRRILFLNKYVEYYDRQLSWICTNSIPALHYLIEFASRNHVDNRSLINATALYVGNHGARPALSVLLG